MYAEETNLSVPDDDDLNSMLYMYIHVCIRIMYMHGYVVNLFFSLCLRICVWQISADNVRSEDTTQQVEAKGK